MSDVVIALFTAHYSESGLVTKGEIWDADHPLVKQHPDWFSSDLGLHVVRPTEVPAKRASKAKAEAKTAAPADEPKPEANTDEKKTDPDPADEPKADEKPAPAKAAAKKATKAAKKKAAPPA